MKKKTPSKQEEALPYWPSKEFMDKAIAQLREKGMVGNDNDLKYAVLHAYWTQRNKILKKTK